MEHDVDIIVEDLMKFNKTGHLNPNKGFSVKSGSEIAVLTYHLGGSRVFCVNAHFYTGSLDEAAARENLEKMIETGVVNKALRKAFASSR